MLRRHPSKAASTAPILLDKLRQTRSGAVLPAWRDIILRDVERLLNDGARSATLDIGHLPHAASSVLNHGLPSFAGADDGAVDAHRWARQLQRILAAFEPRLDPRTIRVAPVIQPHDRNVLALLYDVHGVILSTTERIPLSFRIALDYSCGAIRVVDH